MGGDDTFVSYIFYNNFFLTIYGDGITSIFYNIWKNFRMGKIKPNKSNF